MFAWSLFIVIFGGAYWLLRWIFEAGSQNAAKGAYALDVANHNKAKADWLQRVTNIELEKHVTQAMSNEETAKEYVHELELASERLRIVDKRFLNNFYNVYPHYLNHDHINAIRIVMANRGYLRKSDAEFEIFNQVPNMNKVTPFEYTEAVSRQTEFILWIDEQLKKHGIEDRLCIVLSGETYYFCEKVYTYAGNYTWEPAAITFKIHDFPSHYLDT